jgi:hypothetical protein
VVLASLALAHEQRFHEHAGSIVPDADGQDEEAPCEQHRVIIWSPSSGENVDCTNLRVQVRCREHCRLSGLVAHLYINNFGPLAAFPCDLNHNHDDEEHLTVTVSEAPAIIWTVRVVSTWMHDELQRTDEGHSVTLHSFVPAPLHQHLRPPSRKLPWEGWAQPLHPSVILIDKLQGSGSSLMGQQWWLHSRVSCVLAHREHGMCRLQWLQAHDGELFVYAQQLQRADEESRDHDAAHAQYPSHVNIAPFFPTLKSGCCWGPVEKVHIRPRTVQARCDAVVLHTAFLFAFSNPSLSISAYMGFLSLYKTMRDVGEGRPEPSRTLLIGNIAPPVESGLSLYLSLYMSLTAAPIMSRSELAYAGHVCFRELVVGLSDRPTAPSDFTGARALAAASLGVDLQAAAVHVSVSSSVPPSSASSPLPQLLILQREPSDQFPLNRNWAQPDMLVKIARSLGFDARVVVAAGMSLQQIAEMFANCSAVLGITGDDLGHVWWMGGGGGVLIHVRPYGYGNHSGLEFNSMAALASVAVMDVHLQPHHATVYPWRAPESVFQDAEGYWRYDAEDANRFFSNVGDIRVEDDEVSSWLGEARDLLRQQKQQQQQKQKAQEGQPSFAWSPYEGEQHMLAAMGRYGREFEAALQPNDFVKSADL